MRCRRNEMQQISIHTLINDPEIKEVYPLKGDDEVVRISYSLAVPNGVWLQNNGTGTGGDVSSVLVRDPPPPPLPALRAHLVAKGQQLLAIHMVAPKVPENFFSFPLPILSTLHPNIILEPNLDSNAHPNP